MRENWLFSLFKNDTIARAYFRAIKWRGRRRCPSCVFERKIYRLKDGLFKCGRCRKTFTEFTRTYLERLRVPFNTLAYLLHQFVLGTPALRIHRETGMNLKTVERVFRIFRQAIYDDSLTELRRLSGQLELDETMFGGRRPGKRGWGAEGKTIVFGIYKRNGKVVVFPVPNRKAETLEPLIQRHTRKGSVYFTDDYEGYAIVEARGEHVTVIKERGRPLVNDINGIEGFWSYAKTWLYHYRGVPRKYFHWYLKEIEWRFNNRDTNLFQELVKLLVKTGR